MQESKPSTKKQIHTRVAHHVTFFVPSFKNDLYLKLLGIGAFERNEGIVSQSIIKTKFQAKSMIA